MADSRSVYPEMSLDICVLSDNEAGRLEHYGVWPTCKAHLHISPNEAKRMIENGEARFIGGHGTKVSKPVTMITKHRITIWTPVSTSMPDGTRLTGFKTWGLKPSHR
jgi:hypothetical protein